MPPSRRAGAHLLLMGPLEGRDRVFLMLQPSAGVVNSSGGGSTFIHQNQLPISFLAGPRGGFIWGIKVSVSRTVPHSHPRDANQYTQNQTAAGKRSFSLRNAAAFGNNGEQREKAILLSPGGGGSGWLVASCGLWGGSWIWRSQSTDIWVIFPSPRLYEVSIAF